MAKNMQTNIFIGGKVLPSLMSSFGTVRGAMLGVQNTARQTAAVSKLSGASIVSSFRAVRTASVAAGVGMAYLGKKGLNTASDVQEAQNLQDVTFGKNSKAIDAWAKTADKSYGLAELSAKNYVSTFGSVLKSAGLSDSMYTQMSKNLTGLAGDWSSFRNITQQNSFEKIFSGVASGETEPLRSLGINMTVANLEAFALSKGIRMSYDSMNQATQMALRYAFVMDKSKDAMGDFKRTQDSFANQQRLVGTNFTNISTKLSNRLLPVATKGYVWLNKFLTSIDVEAVGSRVDRLAIKIENAFTKMQPGIIWAVNTGFPLTFKWIGYVFDKAAAFSNFIVKYWPAIEPIVIGIVAALAGFVVVSAAIPVIQGVAAAIAFLGTTAGIVTLVIAALVLAGWGLYKNWDKVTAYLEDVWVSFKNNFIGTVNLIINAVNGLNSVFNKLPGVHIPILATLEYDKTPELRAAKAFQAANRDSYNVGHNATGTNNWGGGWTWVGEQGPELMKLPESTQIRSNNRSMQMAGGDGSVQYVYSPTVYAGNASAGEIKKVLQDDRNDFENQMSMFEIRRRRLAF